MCLCVTWSQVWPSQAQLYMNSSSHGALHCQVGWSRKNLVKKLRENPSGVTLVLKKVPVSLRSKETAQQPPSPQVGCWSIVGRIHCMRTYTRTHAHTRIHEDAHTHTRLHSGMYTHPPTHQHQHILNQGNTSI